MAVILVTHGVPAEGFQFSKEDTVIIPNSLSAFTEEELFQRIPEADAVVACGRLSGDVIRRGKKLVIIANYGAGYDGIDTRAAKEAGVFVTNIPNSVTTDTAQLAIGLMLSASRRIGELNSRLRNEKPETLFGIGKNMGHSLHGRTLGIIGAGRIGTQTALYAKALGMRVLGYRRGGAAADVFEPVSLDEIFRQSDIISLHCPLTTETRGLIDKHAISSMKDGAILINTSRGAVVDTAALMEALASGKLACAGLDVYPDEPHLPEGLEKLSNVVLTPHIGSNTYETRFEMARALSKQIKDALCGKRPENIVNGL